MICKIHNRAFGQWIMNLGSLYGYREIVPPDVTIWLSEKNSTVWIARVNGKPAGYAHGSIEILNGDHSIRNLVFVETLQSLGQSKVAILPEFRNIGVGRALIETASLYGAREGAETVLVLAYSDNAQATGLLSKLGFEHNHVYYYERFSRTKWFVCDSVLARLDLTKPLTEVRVNEKVIIRPIQEDDLKDMITIFSENRPDVFGSAPTVEQIRSWYDAKWGVQTLVAEVKGMVVGCIEHSAKGIIGIPGVMQKYQQMGVGSALFYRLLQSMRQNGYKEALADTGFVMDSAIQMYRRFGFDLSRELWAWVKVL